MSDRRAVVLVLDGCGAGAAPDAPDFGDPLDSATVRHVWEAVGGFSAPNLGRSGFLAACGIGTPNGRFARLRPLGMGKDSVTGHWEMMGAVVERPFPTYPEGFPISLIKQFEREIGTQTLGNRAASGTQIIAELGELHQETGFPIVYTSADSVFQIACHEETVPVEELYGMCRVARRLCSGQNNVQRVIARPFSGSPGAYVRTERRKDFSLEAPPNLVDRIGDVYGVGVVAELFGGRGFRETRRSQSNAEHWLALDQALTSDARFVFANFEDFDMLYGHRNDPAGFAKCLESFDHELGLRLSRLGPETLLALTADHGNDPTDTSTDHTREYAPLALVQGGPEADLGEFAGYTAVGATVASHLGVDWPIGKSLLG
ncbi:MAG: phosphopentomutase [Fimbriimonadaceae bacterium]|nr:phosphopentomutase [Fimbriimonadaceae bacterium]QYK56854.1 MAG: phosphopentomutase [Fimbriimonadaceae bacterium]